MSVELEEDPLPRMSDEFLERMQNWSDPRVRSIARELIAARPAAECWDAIANCYRITCMGSAGLINKSEKGYAHATFNLWTIAGKPPEGATGDAQDLHGRERLCDFIKIAVKNLKEKA